MSRPFAQVDVFSATAGLGNPVAVVLDGAGLTESQMQRLARWTNLSETTFVLPATDPEADYWLRIFTPGGELPFAGHPTLGSAHAWLEQGGRPRHADQLIQQCGAGRVTIRRDSPTLAFAAPPLVRDGELEPAQLARFAQGLGIDVADVVAHQWVDNGPGWAVLQLDSAAEVLALEPDLALIPDAMLGAVGAYPAGSPAAFELRAFAPRVGVAEDPVCGSLNASVAQWLTRTAAAPASYRVSQGARVGRAGVIEISTEPDGTVWVGGATTTVIRGTVTI